MYVSEHPYVAATVERFRHGLRTFILFLAAGVFAVTVIAMAMNLTGPLLGGILFGIPAGAIAWLCYKILRFAFFPKR